MEVANSSGLNFSRCLFKSRGFKLIYFIVILNYPAVAQTTISTADLDLSGDVYSWYDNEIGLKETELQTGSLGVVKRSSRISHVFLSSSLWESGNITYRNSHYNNVALLYNIEKDIVLIKQVGNNLFYQPVELIGNQIEQFSIHDAEFEYYTEKESTLKTGFYQNLFIGTNISLVAKRMKVLKVIAGENNYLPTSKYFVKIGAGSYLIKRKSNLTKLFPEHKKEINQFIRDNQIRFPDPKNDNGFITLTKYCNELLDE